MKRITLGNWKPDRIIEAIVSRPRNCVVTLSKNGQSQTYGTYDDATTANRIADDHRQSGYWDDVTVQPQEQ